MDYREYQERRLSYDPDTGGIVDENGNEYRDETGKAHNISEIEGYNTCDKCYALTASNDLIWPTAEGFEPEDGEIPSQDAYDYDALCEDCYKTVLAFCGDCGRQATTVINTNYRCDRCK